MLFNNPDSSRIYSGRFCVHRWSIVKRWEHLNDFYMIRRCRWCDKWERKKINIGLEASRIEPKIQTEPIVTHKSLII